MLLNLGEPVQISRMDNVMRHMKQRDTRAHILIGSDSLLSKLHLGEELELRKGYLESKSTVDLGRNKLKSKAWISQISLSGLRGDEGGRSGADLREEFIENLQLHINRGHTPEKIFIILGLNDIAKGRSYEKLSPQVELQRIVGFFVQLRSLAPDAQICWGGIGNLKTSHENYVHHRNCAELLTTGKQIGRPDWLCVKNLSHDATDDDIQDVHGHWTDSYAKIVGNRLLDWIELETALLQTKANSTPITGVMESGTGAAITEYPDLPQPEGTMEQALNSPMTNKCHYHHQQGDPMQLAPAVLPTTKAANTRVLDYQHKGARKGPLADKNSRSAKHQEQSHRKKGGRPQGTPTSMILARQAQVYSISSGGSSQALTQDDCHATSKILARLPSRNAHKRSTALLLKHARKAPRPSRTTSKELSHTSPTKAHETITSPQSKSAPKTTFPSPPQENARGTIVDQTSIWSQWRSGGEQGVFRFSRVNSSPTLAQALIHNNPESSSSELSLDGWQAPDVSQGTSTQPSNSTGFSLSPRKAEGDKSALLSAVKTSRLLHSSQEAEDNEHPEPSHVHRHNQGFEPRLQHSDDLSKTAIETVSTTSSGFSEALEDLQPTEDPASTPIRTIENTNMTPQAHKPRPQTPSNVAQVKHTIPSSSRATGGLPGEGYLSFMNGESLVDDDLDLYEIGVLFRPALVGPQTADLASSGVSFSRAETIMTEPSRHPTRDDTDPMNQPSLFDEATRSSSLCKGSPKTLQQSGPSVRRGKKRSPDKEKPYTPLVVTRALNEKGQPAYILAPGMCKQAFDKHPEKVLYPDLPGGIIYRCTTCNERRTYDSVTDFKIHCLRKHRGELSNVSPSGRKLKRACPIEGCATLCLDVPRHARKVHYVELGRMNRRNLKVSSEGVKTVISPPKKQSFRCTMKGCENRSTTQMRALRNHLRRVHPEICDQ